MNEIFEKIYRKNESFSENGIYCNERNQKTASADETDGIEKISSVSVPRKNVCKKKTKTIDKRYFRAKILTIK